MFEEVKTGEGDALLAGWLPLVGETEGTPEILGVVDGVVATEICALWVGVGEKLAETPSEREATAGIPETWFAE